MSAVLGRKVVQMNRRAFLAAAPLAALTQGTLSAQSVPGGSHFVERRADFDAAAFQRAVDRPETTIRQVWHALAFHPQMFSNVKNALNGLQFGFGHPASSIAIAIAAHGPSTVYTYSDALWSKYRLGDAFGLKDAQGNPVNSNVYLKPSHLIDAAADPDDPNGPYQDTSIETLQQRGVVFLTCHTAVEEQARALVKGGYAPAGMQAPQVADDMLTHLIPGAQVVPAMVATIAVLQAMHRYTYIAPAFA